LTRIFYLVFLFFYSVLIGFLLSFWEQIILVIFFNHPFSFPLAMIEGFSGGGWGFKKGKRKKKMRPGAFGQVQNFYQRHIADILFGSGYFILSFSPL